LFLVAAVLKRLWRTSRRRSSREGARQTAPLRFDTKAVDKVRCGRFQDDFSQSAPNAIESGKAGSMRLIPYFIRPLATVALVVGAAGSVRAGQLLPCGVADPGGRTGFVANAHGGIDALDLATGELLWQIDGAKRPALADDDRLFAWAPAKPNGLRILAFKRQEGGRRLMESEPVLFPEWVRVEDGPGHSLTAHWRLEKGRLILDWEARSWYSGGHATPQAEAENRRYADGQVRIDVETGKVETASAERQNSPVRLPKELEKAVFRWQGPVGDAHAALVLEGSDGQQRLSLWSWDAEKTQAPKELFMGKRVRTLPTLDNRFLCLREAAPSPDQEPGPQESKNYGWSIFAVAGGERIAWIPYEAGTEGVAVAGPRAYGIVAGAFKGPLDKPFIRPRILKAYDLKTGKPLWEHPVEGKACLPPAP
jgi:hypothetical protein